MSEQRVTKLGTDIDLAVMEDVCRKLGCTIRKNTTVNGYYGNTNQKCSLVVKHPTSSYEIGFTTDENGHTTAVYDSYADRILQTQIMPAYEEALITNRLHISGCYVENRTETKEEIILKVRRY